MAILPINITVLKDKSAFCIFTLDLSYYQAEIYVKILNENNRQYWAIEGQVVVLLALSERYILYKRVLVAKNTPNRLKVIDSIELNKFKDSGSKIRISRYNSYYRR